MNLASITVSSTSTVVLLTAAVLVRAQSVAVEYELHAQDNPPTCVTTIAAMDVPEAASVVDIDSGEAAEMEVSDHAARIRALLDDGSPALTDRERAASVEWIWRPGVGLVRQS
jgi:hypothetical protein